MKITFLYTPPAPSQPQDAVPAAPLVLLHGWGLDSRVWDALLPHLIEQAPQLPLLAVDLPGYRGTSYAAEDAQAVARALAEQLPAGCTLAGWSLGGMLAQLAALQAQSAMARLVLIGTTPSFIQREGFAAAQPPALLTAFAAGVRALPASVVSRFAALSNQGDSCARSINRQLQALTQEPVPEQAALLAGLDWLQTLETRLTHHTFLYGNRAALADLAIAPFVRQFAGIDDGWWSAQPWPRLQAWLAHWQASSLFEQVMPKLPAWVDGTQGVPFPHSSGMPG